MFDIRTATAQELNERATYLENFSYGGSGINDRYMKEKFAEAKALRELAKSR